MACQQLEVDTVMLDTLGTRRREAGQRCQLARRDGLVKYADCRVAGSALATPTPRDAAPQGASPCGTALRPRSIPVRTQRPGLHVSGVLSRMAHGSHRLRDSR